MLPRMRSLKSLNDEIVNCRKCPRLVEFREKVAREKRKQFSDFDYWGRPITGFGDIHARLVVIGLAPASQGANRTGRVFTGDKSARFLVRHLYRAGFANQPTSETRDDGLKYYDCYVTAVVRCVPPGDKPTRLELETCAPYLEEELKLLKDAKVVLALGKIAFDSIIKFAKKNYGIEGSFKFEHGKKYTLSSEMPVIFASYHTSPRNTNTGKLTDDMFAKILDDIKTFLDKKT